MSIEIVSDYDIKGIQHATDVLNKVNELEKILSEWENFTYDYYFKIDNNKIFVSPHQAFVILYKTILSEFQMYLIDGISSDLDHYLEEDHAKNK